MNDYAPRVKWLPGLLLGTCLACGDETPAAPSDAGGDREPPREAGAPQAGPTESNPVFTPSPDASAPLLDAGVSSDTSDASAQGGAGGTAAQGGSSGEAGTGGVAGEGGMSSVAGSAGQTSSEDAGPPLAPYTGPPDPGASDLLEGPDAFPVLPDPLPAEPLLSEPQPMSGHYLLFVEHNTLVRLLDLETGEIRDLSSNDEPTIYPTTSPDGRSFMFSGTEHAQDATWHVRFTDDTVTPVHEVEGFEGLDGNGTLWDWSFDSRFLRSTRYGQRMGLEIIDAVLNRRVGGYVFDSNIGGTFVPNSYYFWMTGIDGRHAIGKVTDTGLSERKILPEGTTGMSFSRDGKRGFMRVENRDTGERSYYLFELPGQMRRFEMGDLDPASVLGAAIVPEGNAVYALVADGDARHFYRIFIDDGRAEPYGDQSLIAYGIRRANNTDLVAVSYRDETGVLYLSLAKGDIITEPVARPGRDDPGPVYLSGNHYGYGIPETEWHVASLDEEGQLVDTVISEPGEEYFGCMTFTAINPVDRIAIRTQFPVPAMIFVDMSTPVARRLATFPVETEGSTVACPVWSVDGNACVYIELETDGNTKFRLVRWGEDGPSEPETVYQSFDGPVPYLVMP